MAQKVFPTKGNLMLVKRSLALARLGYDLLDRKRNVMVMEMMQLIDKAKELQDVIGDSFSTAYESLQRADMAIATYRDIAEAVPVDEGLKINMRSVMGVEIPRIYTTTPSAPRLYYGFMTTNSKMDEAYITFNKLKELITTLAEIENSVYRLATAIKKTQTRANSLKNIIIPRYTAEVKFITDFLEEKEREEFTRLKVIKNKKQRAQ